MAVFESTESERLEYSCTVHKSYKVKGSEEYKETKYFFQQELPLVAAALTDAFHAIQSIRDEDGRE